MRTWPSRSRERSRHAISVLPSSNALIAGARKAVIQSSPAGLISSLIRAWVTNHPGRGLRRL